MIIAKANALAFSATFGLLSCAAVRTRRLFLNLDHGFAEHRMHSVYTPTTPTLVPFRPSRTLVPSSIFASALSPRHKSMLQHLQGPPRKTRRIQNTAMDLRSSYCLPSSHLVPCTRVHRHRSRLRSRAVSKGKEHACFRLRLYGLKKGKEKGKGTSEIAIGRTARLEFNTKRYLVAMIINLFLQGQLCNKNNISAW